MNYRRSLLAVTLGAMTALTGCTSDEVLTHTHPELDPLPPPPAKVSGKVTSFKVSPTSIKKGEKATLTWEVADAVTVTVKERNGKGVPGVDGAALTGTVEVAPDATTTYILSAINEGGAAHAIVQLKVHEAAVEIPEAPLLFAPVPEEINAGQTAHLVWSGPGAIEITEKTSGAAIVTAGPDTGSIAVSPTQSTTYVAKSGKQQLEVAIKVKPAIALFVSTPAAAGPGQKLTLRWRTAGATDVKLSERNRGDLYTAQANERNEGSFEDTIPATLSEGFVQFYQLTVNNPDGLKTATVQVIVSNAPVIDEFKGQVALTKNGTTKPTLIWKTTNAASVSIYSVSPSALLFRAPSSLVANGSIELPLPQATTEYELVADSAQGGQSTARWTVKMVDAPQVPTLTATPDTLANGGDQTTLAWTALAANELFVAPVGGSSIFVTRDPAEIATGSVTVNPGNTHEYEVVVRNEAGDTASKTVTVSVTQPMGFLFDPTLAMAGTQVTMNWDFFGATSVYGAPVGETRTGPEPFIDISTDPAAKELTSITGATTGKAELLPFPDGFKFQHFGVMYGKAFITNRGWIGFDETYPNVQTTTVADPSTGTPNNLICGWCAENLSNGKIYWALKGTAPNRQFIVQWDKFKGTASGSVLTFEIVLNENGQVDILYNEMTGAGATTVIKLENKNGSYGYKSTVTAAPAPGTAIVFNGASATTGSATFGVAHSLTYTLYVEKNGLRIPVTASLPVIGANSVKLTEVMYKPVTGATAGQWLELHNTSGSALDASIFSIKTTAGTVQLPAFTIPNDSYVVVGQSKDPGANGDTLVDIEVPTLALGTTDTVELMLGTNVISSITYDDATINGAAGASVWRNTGFGSAFCVAPATYGTAGSMGTPHAAQTGCGGYTIGSIPANFRDIGATGNVLMEDDYGTIERFDFPATFKFPYDGADRTFASAGNGYLTFDPAVVDDLFDDNSDNPTTFPDSSIPGGIVAVFWDDYGVYDGGMSGKYWQHFPDPDSNPATNDGYLIVSWQEFDFLGNSGRIDCQVWLYENGTIDFQWGIITPGSKPADVVNGTTATIGLMNMAKTQVIPVGHLQNVMAPNTAIRFTPN